MSMMESCMPAESDLPAWYIQWVRYRRVCLISVQSAAEFACSKWRICDFEVHPFGSLEDDTIHALSPVTGGDAENMILSYRYPVLAGSRKKGEFITALSLYTRNLGNLQGCSYLRISSLPHLLPMPSAYLDTPTQLPDRAMQPEISPED